MSTRRSPLVLALAGLAVALLACGSTASAQTQSLFGGTGGGGTTAGAPAGAGTGGQNTPQGAAFEQGGPAITTELGNLSQSAGQQTFLGRGEATGGLIGNAGAQGGGGQAGGGNVPDFSAGGGGRGGQGGGGGGGNQGRRSVIRPVLRIAFDFPQMAPVAVDASLRTRVATIATQRPEFGGVEVRVDEVGNATVTGVVPTDAHAKLALALARLEPGVRNVNGDLAIQTPPIPPGR